MSFSSFSFFLNIFKKNVWWGYCIFLIVNSVYVGNIIKNNLTCNIGGILTLFLVILYLFRYILYMSVFIYQNSFLCCCHKFCWPITQNLIFLIFLVGIIYFSPFILIKVKFCCFPSVSEYVSNYVSGSKSIPGSILFY